MSRSLRWLTTGTWSIACALGASIQDLHSRRALVRRIEPNSASAGPHAPSAETLEINGRVLSPVPGSLGAELATGGDEKDQDGALGYQTFKQEELPSNLTEFQVKMQRQLVEERFYSKNFSKPLPSKLSVLIGVLSCPDDDRARHIIRTSWMLQPFVCQLGAKDKSKCVVTVAFVVGNGKTNTTKELGDGVVQVDSPDGYSCRGNRSTENFCGLRRKAARWFEWASRHYAGATHIAQLDQDYYPHLTTTLWSFANLTDPRQFIGRTIHGFNCDNDLDGVHADAMRGIIPERDKWGNHHNYFKRYCTVGDLVFLSKTLAYEMTMEPFKYFDLNTTRDDCYHQDQWIGSSVTDFVMREKKRVVTTFKEDKVNFAAFPGIR